MQSRAPKTRQWEHSYLRIFHRLVLWAWLREWNTHTYASHLLRTFSNNWICI